MKYTLLIGIVVGALLLIVTKTSLLSGSRPAAKAVTAQPLVKKAGPSVKNPADDGWTPAIDVSADNLQFTDSESSVKGIVPMGWKLSKALRRNNTETSLIFSSKSHPKAALTVYFRKLSNSEKKGPAAIILKNAMREKTAQRIASGFVGYKSKDEAERTIKGRTALSWSADFSQNNEPWEEHLTRMEDETFSVLFLLNAPAKDIEAMKVDYETLVSGADFPATKT